jgi:ubiquinone/menaquinone biosynthesis C-methylase UbiE
MGLEKQGGKPKGILGMWIGRLMNKCHTSFYINYFNTLPSDNSKILDIGCGGGKFIHFLASSNKTYMLFGLDHSAEMVDLSQKINRVPIEQNRVGIFHGSVTKIPLDNSQLDLVTAFETVQFWPDINISFMEVARVLKEGGEFLIINRYPLENSKWWRMAKIKSDKNYRLLLEKSGFTKISIDTEYKKGWILVKGTKR